MSPTYLEVFSLSFSFWSRKWISSKNSSPKKYKQSICWRISKKNISILHSRSIRIKRFLQKIDKKKELRPKLRFLLLSPKKKKVNQGQVGDRRLSQQWCFRTSMVLMTPSKMSHRIDRRSNVRIPPARCQPRQTISRNSHIWTSVCIQSVTIVSGITSGTITWKKMDSSNALVKNVKPTFLTSKSNRSWTRLFSTNLKKNSTRLPSIWSSARNAKSSTSSRRGNLRTPPRRLQKVWTHLGRKHHHSLDG